MAAATSSIVLVNEASRYCVMLHNRYVDTAESAALKVDVSGLTNQRGEALTSLSINSIYADVQGYERVDLLFDATTDEVIFQFGPGQQYLDFTKINGRPLLSAVARSVTGATGDILATTVGTTATDTYSIILDCTKNG